MAKLLTPEEIAAKLERYAIPEPMSGCTLWLGAQNGKGYGQITGCRKRKAHVVAWEIQRGPVPNGLVLDHICRNRQCINPDHLRAVTPRQNIMLGFGPPAVNARKHECPRGHPYDAVTREGWRRCNQCENERKRLSKAKKRAVLAAARSSGRVSREAVERVARGIYGRRLQRRWSLHFSDKISAADLKAAVDEGWRDGLDEARAAIGDLGLEMEEAPDAAPSVGA